MRLNKGFEMKTIINKHTKKRLKQRVGLSKRAHIRHVLQKGKYLFRNLTDKKFYIKMEGKDYVFSWTSKPEPILLTVKYDYNHLHL
jgi:hypothetical protein